MICEKSLPKELDLIPIYEQRSSVRITPGVHPGRVKWPAVFAVRFRNKDVINTCDSAGNTCPGAAIIAFRKADDICG